MMKNIIFSALSLAVALMSCTVNEVTEVVINPQAGEAVSFIGTFATDTKTSIVPTDGAKSNVVWNTTDHIGVFGVAADNSTSLGGNIEYTADEAAATTAFTAVSTSMTYGDGEGNRTFYAYYPYSASVADLNSVSTSVPATQTYSAGDNSAKMFMYASATVAEAAAVNFTFHNLFAIVEFGLKCQGVTLTQMTIEPMEIEDCTALTGNVIVDLSAPTIGTPTATSKKITVNFAGGLQLGNEEVWIPVAVLPFTCNGGLQLTFTDNQGNVYNKTVWQSKRVNSEIDGQAIIEANTHIRQSLGNIIADNGDGKVNLSAPYGTSNCYIASEAGTDYKFVATVMGNGYTTPATTYSATDKNCAPGITPQALATASAKVLWQTAAGLITDVAVADGYISFKTDGTIGGILTEGNAVIAAYASDDCTGDIIWSWHIWVTAADLEEKAMTYTLNSTYQGYSEYASPVVMDRNLGALDYRSFIETNNNKALGLKYQWGRKDPFLCSNDSSYSSASAINTYDADGYQITNGMNSTNATKKTYSAFDNTLVWKNMILADPTTATIENSIKNPMSFICRVSTTTNNWLYSADNLSRSDLWGLPKYSASSNDVGHKSIYDPCPAGWRVPHGYYGTGFTSTGKNSGKKITPGWTAAEWYSTNVNTATQYGLHLYINNTNSGATTYYPCAGMIDYIKGTISRSGTYCYYWTASAYSSGNYNAIRFDIDANNINVTAGAARSYGHSVRCMKEK